MLPVIFTVGPFTLYSYWLVAFTAFFAGMFVIWKRGRELHFEEKTLFDGLMVIGWWALVGARIGYILLHLSEFGTKIFWYIDIISKPGWWIIGGFIGGITAVVRRSINNKWNVFELTDVIVPGLVLAQAILAFGDFLNGSGSGLVSNTILGVRFNGMYDKRLPVQLYESTLLWMTFAFLWWSEGAYRTFGWYKGSRSEAQSGFISAVYLIAYGGLEFLLSWLRPNGLSFGVVRIDSLTSVIVLLFGCYILWLRTDRGMVKKWRGTEGSFKRKPGNSEK